MNNGVISLIRIRALLTSIALSLIIVQGQNTDSVECVTDENCTKLNLDKFCNASGKCLCSKSKPLEINGKCYRINPSDDILTVVITSTIVLIIIVALIIIFCLCKKGIIICEDGKEVKCIWLKQNRTCSERNNLENISTISGHMTGLSSAEHSGAYCNEIDIQDDSESCRNAVRIQNDFRNKNIDRPHSKSIKKSVLHFHMNDDESRKTSHSNSHRQVHFNDITLDEV